MLNRKVFERLEKWKEKNPSKCLIVEGARQVGKTFAVREFARNNYTSFIELNFIETPSLANIFADSLDPDTILMQLSLYLPGSRIIEGDTIIFLDEIQECAEAITALKFLATDKRIDVICSGSALGMEYKPQTSYPAGSIEYIDMYSLDFEEYLWARGVDLSVIETLKGLFENENYDKKVPKAMHEKMNRYLREYMVLGGMPEVIQTFVNTGDFYQADQIQRRLYRDYINDIARYAKPEIKIKAEQCYKSIPMQLSKENHKFKFSKVEKGATSARFGSSIDWLARAHIIVPVYNLRQYKFPLKSYAIDNNFRIYPNDIGLLICAYPYELKQAILEDTSMESKPSNIILGTTKGGMYEALAAEMLHKQGREELFFYRSDTGTCEIEFFIEGRDGVIPVEVKAGRSKTKSLNAILEDKDIKYGYKFATQNIGTAGKKITMPMYMIMFL